MKSFFKKLTKTGKLLFISTTISLLFLCCGGVGIIRTINYIIAHGEEVENFQPYTIEQAKRDELKTFGYNIK